VRRRSRFRLTRGVVVALCATVLLLEALLFGAAWAISQAAMSASEASVPPASVPQAPVPQAPVPQAPAVVTSPAPIAERGHTGLPLPFPVFPSFPELRFAALHQVTIDAHGFEPLLREAALRHAIPPQLVLMQVMPATGARFGVQRHELIDPHRNVAAGTAYLAWLLNRYRGDLDLTLAAYNAGEGAVDRYRGIPPYPETQEYVRKVRRALQTASSRN
jgi:hypothetical protein